MRGSRFIAALWVMASSAGALAIAADPSDKELARQLVEIMGADRRAADQMHGMADAQFRDGTIKLAQRECIRHVGREEFTERLANLVEQRLKPDEMRDGIAYFTSEVGRKHLAAIEQKASVAAEDWPERRAFLDTTAGYLLITRGLVTSSDEAARLVLLFTGRRFRECARPA